MKSNLKNWPRYVLQWGILALMVIFFTKIFGTESADPEAYCPLGGLETLATYLKAGSMACSMTATQIMMGVVLGICVILFSKLFCGYLCPLGTLQELMSRLRRGIHVKELVIRQGGIIDRVLRIIKYALLFVIFYMTITSSELFCKNMDPYYAMATGFKGEITVWMVWVSMGLLFLGSFFVKMFWCKYICPLGALSHIFKFTITFVVYLGIYIGLGQFGINISWVWLLGACCLTGYIWEMVYMRSKVFPLLTVVRSPMDCTNCKLCEKRCPYHINITDLTKVNAIDCTLCGECISSCKTNALKVNGKYGLRWLPVVLVMILLPLAVFLGGRFELPTIDERWGDESKLENLEMMEMTGLKSVKCFGSSKTFAAKLQKIPGVYGVATFVKKHNVHIYYQDNETTVEKIQENLFVPSKFKIATPPAQSDTLKVITIHTDQMFDKLDVNYLGLKFKNLEKGYYGLESEFGCPLIIRIYMDNIMPVDEQEIKATVESKELVMKLAGGKENRIPAKYKFVELLPGENKISRMEFLNRQFGKFEKTFTPKDTTWTTLPVSVYRIAGMALDKPIVSRFLPYLASHVSHTQGITAVNTLLDQDGNPVLDIHYIPEKLSEAALIEVLQAPQWTITYADGTEKIEDAKIQIPQGNTIK